MKTVSSLLRLAVPAVSLLVASQAWAVGETTGQVAGYVYDPTGAPLSDVPLTLKGPALQQPITRTSGADGRYEISGLPVGDHFVLEVTVPGFTPIVQKGIPVRLGQTSAVDVNLTVLTETQAVQTFQIVEKVNPIMNTDSAQAVSVVTAEKATETPMFTQPEGIPQQVAGTSFSNSPVTRGGLSRYGRFYVDGLDTTDISSGSMTSPVNFFTVDNYEVVTGGFDAQYNALGMVENVVTKRGSNEFTVDAVATLSPSFISAANTAPGSANLYSGLLVNSTTPGPLTQFYSPILSVGGPIVKDRLWFYASFQANFSDRETPLSNFYMAQENRPTVTFTQIGRIKLTWQPTERDRASFTINLDHNEISNLLGSASVTDNAESHINRGGVMLIGNYDHNFTDNLLLELQTGLTYKKSNQDPQVLSSNPSHFDLSDQVTQFNASGIGFGQDENYLHEDKTRFQFDPSLALKLGNHQLKTGVQIEYMADAQLFGVLGDLRYTDRAPLGATSGGVCDPVNAPQYCFKVTQYYAGADANLNGIPGPLTTTATAINSGIYLQDRWNVNRHFTVMPGIRFDMGNLQGQAGSPQIPTLFGVGPRIGATYDVFGDRKSLVLAHYGRSNDVGDVFMAQHANPSLLEVTSLFTAGAFPACTPNSATNPQAPPGGQALCTIQGGSAGRSFASNQTPPSTDEISAGFHQEIAPLTAIGVDFDWRRYSNMWVDQEVNRVWDPSGTKVIGFLNGIPQTVFVSRTSPLAYRDYQGLDLWIQGNPGRWDLMASYTLSFSSGTVGDYFDGYLGNPRMNIFANGYTSDDHRHQVKGSIAYQAPFGLDIGARLKYQSGGAVSESFPNFADVTGSNFYRSPRGTGYAINPATGTQNFNDPSSWTELRTPDLFNVDLEARYNLGQALGLKAKLELEAFVLDVFNDYSPQGFTATYSSTGVNRFGFVTSRNGPLQGEIILRYRN